MKYSDYKTKISKKRKCQELLKKGYLEKEDKEFLNELLKEHPNYEIKKGCGILDFFIKETYWKQKGFYLKRLDGSETDFSYNQCLLPRTKLQKIKMACRTAISLDMIGSVSRGNIAHHKTPFIDIFNLWIKDKDLDKLETEESKDNSVMISFKDKKIAEDFRNFHNSIAIIKEISPEEHKKIHSKSENANK